MTVAELITFLQSQQQDLLVAYKLFSEQAVMNKEDIEVKELGLPREDGWIHDNRPDKPSQKYLLFPGN